MKYNKASVWVIDDEEDVLHLCSSSLSKNFEVTTFTLPSKLLKAAESSQPDLFIIDYVLPEISGLELLKNLRDNKVTKPVIILSGAAMYREAMEFIQLGVADLIEKPFFQDRLVFAASRAIAGGMSLEARDNLIVAYSELVEAYQGMVNHLDVIFDGDPKLNEPFLKIASERVQKARKLVEFIQKKQDMLDVMVGHYSEG